MCCQQLTSRRKRGRELSTWIFVASTSVVVMCGLIQETCAEVMNTREGADAEIGIFPPMKRNKPPKLPCGAVISLQAGDEYFIQSPDFPVRRYPNSVNCQWQFSANQCNMGINCPDFQLADFLCFDHLDIIDHNGTMNRYCGKKGPKETVLANNVTISFTSSAWFHDIGFRCRVVCRENEEAENESPFEKPSATPTDCHCGKPNQKVTGGEPTEISIYPWQAGLVRKGGSHPFCGGSLINDRYVLTAAHCVKGRTPYNLEIVFNVTDFKPGDPLEVRRLVENILVHKKFTSRLDYDAALIRLSEPVDISGKSGDNILPVCLPSSEDIHKTYVGENATVTGWGLDKEDGDLSSVLQKADVAVISNEECAKHYPTITDRMLCAHTPGKDACQGDSGGPLQYEEGENNADMIYRFVQIGIVSWGQGCGVNPGVYTRVTELIKWIATNSKDGSYCNNI